MFRVPAHMLLVLATALVVQFLAGTPIAFGAADTETQNPDLTVSLTVPDQASVGETVQAKISITNNTRRFETIVVEGNWTDPNGVDTVTTRNGMLLPGQTVSRVIDYEVKDSSVRGTHVVTIRAQDRNGASTATANVEVV